MRQAVGLDQRGVVIVVADAVDCPVGRAGQRHRGDVALCIAVGDADVLLAQRAECALDLLVNRGLRGVVARAVRDIDERVEVDRVLDAIDRGQIGAGTAFIDEPACRNREAEYESREECAHVAGQRQAPDQGSLSTYATCDRRILDTCATQVALVESDPREGLRFETRVASQAAGATGISAWSVMLNLRPAPVSTSRTLLITSAATEP